MAETRTAVVTGGAGFIGSHLVDALASEGWRVRVVDNLSSGRIKNLEQHLSNHEVEMVNADILDSRQLTRVLRGVDSVFHFAAFADLRKSIQNRRLDLENNLLGTLNLLESMTECGVTDLVEASTSSLYGRATVLPTPESYHPTQTSLYGASKLAAEAFTEAYSELNELRVCCFRFSNVIGTRCRRGVIWDFVSRLLKDPTQLLIYGDGTQSKEFLDVSDCIAGILLGHERATARFNLFNLGNRVQTTPDDIATVVIEELGLSHVRIAHTGGRGGWIGDNPRVELDLSRLSALGWTPQVPVIESVRKTVRWTREEVSRQAELAQEDSVA